MNFFFSICKYIGIPIRKHSINNKENIVCLKHKHNTKFINFNILRRFFMYKYNDIIQYFASKKINKSVSYIYGVFTFLPSKDLWHERYSYVTWKWIKCCHFLESLLPIAFHFFFFFIRIFFSCFFFFCNFLILVFCGMHVVRCIWYKILFEALNLKLHILVCYWFIYWRKVS